MFGGLTPEAEALLNAAAADLPVAQADAGLLAAMAAAVSDGTLATPVPSPRRNNVLGKVLTAKAAAIAGVLVFTGGVASAATGSLPDLAQDAAHDAANVVGIDLPEGKEHPENHGKDVSGVARDKSNDGDENHGTAVCTVASEGKCKSGDDADDDGDDTGTPNHGNSADHRQDGEHRNGKSVDDDTTTTTVADDADDDDFGDDTPQPASDQGKNRGKSGENKPSDD